MVEHLDCMITCDEMFTRNQLETLRGILRPNNERGQQGTGLFGPLLYHVMNGAKCGFTKRYELLIYTFHHHEEIISFLEKCGYTTSNGYGYFKDDNLVGVLRIEDIGDYLFKIYGPRKTASGEMVYYDGTDIWVQPTFFNLFARNADDLCAIKQQIEWKKIEDLYAPRDEIVADLIQKIII